MRLLSIIFACLLIVMSLAPAAFPEEKRQSKTDQKAEPRESVKKSHEGKIGKRDVAHGPSEQGSTGRSIGGCPEGPPCEKKATGGSVATK